jgi:hypothetical protein
VEFSAQLFGASGERVRRIAGIHKIGTSFLASAAAFLVAEQSPASPNTSGQRGDWPLNNGTMFKNLRSFSLFGDAQQMRFDPLVELKSKIQMSV